MNSKRGPQVGGPLKKKSAPNDDEDRFLGLYYQVNSGLEIGLEFAGHFQFDVHKTVFSISFSSLLASKIAKIQDLKPWI